ncbi:MAG: hypothetical protein M9887_00395 [Chitinophagales bacterium]|nr:hypothetical protein [Chitinophagales bacterium]
MKKKSLLIISALLLVSLFNSCEKEYEAPVSNVVDMSGRWWIQLWLDTDGDGVLNHDNDYLYLDYADTGFDFTTSNDAANSKDSLWLVDNAIWPFQSKIAVNTETKEFVKGDYISIIPSQDPSVVELVTSIEGKIIPKGATSLIGKKVDSIFFKVEFADSPGDVFYYSGIKYTGQPDEDY